MWGLVRGSIAATFCSGGETLKQVMAIEALRTQLDAVLWEKRELDAENRRLREDNPEAVRVVELEEELAQSKAELAQSKAELAQTVEELEQSKAELECMSEQLGEIPRLEQDLDRALQETRSLRQASAANGRGEGQDGTGETELRRLTRELTQATEAAEQARKHAEESACQLEYELRRYRKLGEELERVGKLLEEMERGAELNRYQAVSAEKAKWEAREERLVEQLTEAKERLKSLPMEAIERQRASERLSAPDPYVVPSKQTPPGSRCGDNTVPVWSQAVAPTSRARTAELEMSPVDLRDGTMRPDPDLGNTQPTQVLPAQQLPQVPTFNGEERTLSGETFEEWREQFEMVATLSGWDARTKLVNLATRLRGQAYAFYRSCTLARRADYDTLVEELARRFTPVHLQAVQSSRFHERTQKPHESVDDFAQDLQQLFHRAYPTTQIGTREAEELGRSVLANHFISGLRPELKNKIVGLEGDLE